MAYHFKYKLTAEDFAEYNVYTSWHASWQKKTRRKYLINTGFFFFISMVAAIIVIDKLKGDTTNFIFLFTASGIITLIFTLFAYYQVPHSLRNKSRKFVIQEENAHILNDTDLEISEDGIINVDKATRIHLKWTSITRYSTTKEYFFLYTNSFQAQIIPKRLFISPEAISEFDKFLSEKIPLASAFRSIGI